jgi:hypothetical protein
VVVGGCFNVDGEVGYAIKIVRYATRLQLNLKNEALIGWPDERHWERSRT